MTTAPSFTRRALRAAAIGLPGVIVIPFAVAPPPGAPAAALLVGPLLTLVVAALVGAWAAPRVGARSALVLGSRIDWRTVGAASAAGVALGVAVALGDEATATVWRGAEAGVPTLIEAAGPAALALGTLYGGATEEILMRWGMLCLILAGLDRIVGRAAGGPTAIALAAAIFALSHLPAIAALDPSTGEIWRTLGWNFVLGVAFGHAFLSRGLEAAMAAHAGFHVGVACAALVARALF